MCKGVSDLEMCMDYFALSGRSCENVNFLSSMLFKANGGIIQIFTTTCWNFKKIYTLFQIRDTFTIESLIFFEKGEPFDLAWYLLCLIAYTKSVIIF